MRRPRGPGGRFLTADEIAAMGGAQAAASSNSTKPAHAEASSESNNSHPSSEGAGSPDMAMDVSDDVKPMHDHTPLATSTTTSAAATTMTGKHTSAAQSPTRMTLDPSQSVHPRSQVPAVAQQQPLQSRPTPQMRIDLPAVPSTQFMSRPFNGPHPYQSMLVRQQGMPGSTPESSSHRHSFPSPQDERRSFSVAPYPSPGSQHTRDPFSSIGTGGSAAAATGRRDSFGNGDHRNPFDVRSQPSYGGNSNPSSYGQQPHQHHSQPQQQQQNQPGSLPGSMQVSPVNSPPVTPFYSSNADPMAYHHESHRSSPYGLGLHHHGPPSYTTGPSSHAMHGFHSHVHGPHGHNTQPATPSPLSSMSMPPTSSSNTPQGGHQPTNNGGGHPPPPPMSLSLDLSSLSSPLSTNLPPSPMSTTMPSPLSTLSTTGGDVMSPMALPEVMGMPSAPGTPMTPQYPAQQLAGGGSGGNGSGPPPRAMMHHVPHPHAHARHHHRPYRTAKTPAYDYSAYEGPQGTGGGAGGGERQQGGA
jgi:hypothetical protein